MSKLDGATNIGTTNTGVNIDGSFFINGVPITAGIGGLNESIQFNDDGALGGSALFVFDKTALAMAIGIANADASAILDLTSVTQGFLMPRMTEAERDAIVSPASGLEIYNTDANEPEYFNGTSWSETADTTIYTGDGIIDSTTRLVQGVNGSQLLIEMNDGTSSSFANRTIAHFDDLSLQIGYEDGNGGSSPTGRSIILFTEDEMEILDSHGLRGLVYAADYSTFGALNDRWLPDKAWVDGQTFYTADGTIDTVDRTVTGTNGAVLAFQMNDLTNTNYNGRSVFSLDEITCEIGYDIGDGLGATTAAARISFDANEISVLDEINSKGMIYDADYSANFTDRSLVDKAYVDSVSAPITNVSFTSAETGVKEIVVIDSLITLSWDADNWLLKFGVGDIAPEEVRLKFVILRSGVNGDDVITPDSAFLNANGEFIVASEITHFLTNDFFVNTDMDLTDANQTMRLELSYYGTNSSVPARDINIDVFSRGNTAAGGVDITVISLASTLEEDLNLIYYLRFASSLLVETVLSSPFALSSATLMNDEPTPGDLPTVGNADDTGGDNALILLGGSFEQYLEFDDTSNIVSGDTTIDFTVNYLDFSQNFAHLIDFNTGPAGADCIAIFNPPTDGQGSLEIRNAAASVRTNLVLNGQFIAGEWHRYTYTITGDATPEVKLYIDAVLMFEFGAVTTAGTTFGLSFVAFIQLDPIQSIERTFSWVGKSSFVSDPFPPVSLFNVRIFDDIVVPT